MKRNETLGTPSGRAISIDININDITEMSGVEWSGVEWSGVEWNRSSFEQLTI
jgi:hypothetical protein